MASQTWLTIMIELENRLKPIFVIKLVDKGRTVKAAEEPKK